MSRGYRSRIKILFDILKQIKILEYEDGIAKPTKIMYRANLSYERLKIYLEELNNKNLIERTKDGYRITEDGDKMLNELEKIINLLKAFGFEP